MKFHFDVVVHVENARLEGKIDHLANLVQRVLKGQRHMAGELDLLESKIAPMTSAVDGAVVLLGELSALIRASAMDPARVLAVADQIDQKTAALAQAIVDNTPAAP